jgi:DNA-binding NarL/FixJ family response regulator
VEDSKTGSTSITLYSAQSNLQTGLLAQLISEELGVECKLEKSIDIANCDASLLLMDCYGQTLEELRSLAERAQNRDKPLTIALLNAEYHSAHEDLLEWPCVAGVFYGDTNQEQLLRGLKGLLAGEYWVPRNILHRFLDKNRRPPTLKQPDVKLTKRERQILILIRDSATNMDISAALDVSEHTVKSHLYNIYRKINVRNRLEASNWARTRDLTAES